MCADEVLVESTPRSDHAEVRIGSQGSREPVSKEGLRRWLGPEQVLGGEVEVVRGRRKRRKVRRVGMSAGSGVFAMGWVAFGVYLMSV